MRVSDIQVIQSGCFCEVRAEVRFHTLWVWGDKPFVLFYRLPIDVVDYLNRENGDRFVAALLDPAMLLGEELRIEAAVSAQLFTAVPTIQSIYGRWNEDFQTVPVTAGARLESTKSNVETGPGIGLFFFMGVDSSYNLAKNLDAHPNDESTISHLIVTEGFDVYLWKTGRFPPMLEQIERVGKIFGKSVLPAATNLRDVSDRIVSWDGLQCGPALASIVLALEPMFRRVHISAGQTYSLLTAVGVHPLVDPLWSSEQVTFVHNGLEADWLAKVKFLGRYPDLVENLRVCNAIDETGVYNCGECEKCLRTMLNLHVVGMLTRCATLPHSINPDRIGVLAVSNPNLILQLESALAKLGSSPEDARIRAAIRESLARSNSRPRYLQPAYQGDA